MTGLGDLVAGALLLTGAVFSFTAGVGLLRLSGVLSRLHTTSKPQLVGLILVLIAVGLRSGSPLDIGMLVLTAAFQLLTAPVTAHMIGRAAYRSGHAQPGLQATDELRDALRDEPPLD